MLHEIRTAANKKHKTASQYYDISNESNPLDLNRMFIGAEMQFIISKGLNDQIK